MMDKATPLHHHHHHLTRHGSSSSSVSLSTTSKQSKTVLPLHHKYNRQMSDRSDRSASNSPPSYRRQTHRFNSGGSFGSRQGSSGEDHDGDHWNNVSLPTWSANPQSPVDDTSTTAAADRSSPTSHLPHHHHHSSHHHHHHQYPYHHSGSSFNFSYPQSWRRICSLQTLFYSICLGVGIAVALQSRGSLTESMEHLGQLMQNGHILQDMMNDAEKQIKLLHREVSAYDVMLNQQQQQHHPFPHAIPQTDSPTQPALSALSRQQQQQHAPHNQALEEMQQLDARLQDAQKKAETLKRQVQALSKKEALAKYGNHVHRVELELAFPDRRDGPTKFVIELAPLDLMPHSVHFFLEMVHAGLLDGCSFILNALHVLKAAPLPYDGSSAANKARAFTRMGLESVAFKEYAPSYPHEQYTVGFAADGSPSFYINTEDNSEIHLGDPCFGKIVEGFDTVKRLEGAPTRNGIWFEQRIGIHRATVLM